MHNNLLNGHHRMELLTSPSSIFSALIDDLHHARESIDMEYYIFANDRTGGLFANLLCRKAKQGLRVRLIVDGFGSMSLSRSMAHKFVECGVEFTSHSLLRRARHHRKMAIIDGRIAHIGGINIADRYVVGNNLGAWYDAQLRLSGGAVTAVARLFDYDFMMSEGAVCEVPLTYSHSGLEVVWSEARGGYAMAELLREVIASARKQLLITTPYFMPPAGVMMQLSSAVARGVEVTIVVPERCDVWLLDHVMRRHVASAHARGINIRICRGAFVHAKMGIVDDRSVVIGSANLDARSLGLNHEIMAVVTNRYIVGAARGFVDRLLAHTSEPNSRDKRSAIPGVICRCFENLL